MSPTNPPITPAAIFPAPDLSETMNMYNDMNIIISKLQNEKKVKKFLDHLVREKVNVFGILPGSFCLA